MAKYTFAYGVKQLSIEQLNHNNQNRVKLESSRDHMQNSPKHSNFDVQNTWETTLQNIYSYYSPTSILVAPYVPTNGRLTCYPHVPINSLYD
jgi:hypothetical protein